MDPPRFAAPSPKRSSAIRHALLRSPSCFAVNLDPHCWPWISAAIHKPNRSTFALMIWRLMMNSLATKTTTPTIATTSSNLSSQLQHIGLCALPTQLDDFIARATKSRWSTRQILEQLVKAEAAERSRRSLERRLRISGIKTFKPMADFDWSWPTKIERDVIQRALTLDFMGSALNLILVGRKRSGKNNDRSEHLPRRCARRSFRAVSLRRGVTGGVAPAESRGPPPQTAHLRQCWTSLHR